VTDIVNRSIGDPTDDRLAKRVLRLSSRYDVSGLKLVGYCDCHEATLYVPETNSEFEADQTHAVDAIEILGKQVP